MKDIQRIMLENEAWVKEKTQVNPDYFKEMAKGQTPTFLWIGCSDSRVPPNEITGTAPGEMFVARNIANLVIHTDLSLMSVVDYAVHHLKTKHIIICGHYGCGGVRASLSPANLGSINKWLRHIKDIANANWTELEKIGDPIVRADRLVELSTIEQARNLTHTAIIQEAWAKGMDVYIHGMVFDISTGKLKQLITIDKTYPIEPVYRYEIKV
jgi:carbonic anhydrase